MTLDHYAPCPCGSGKKLKFCKCIDQPQEYEKLLKLIEGEQNLAAVDRINQLLAKTPNAAWLLALKGQLTLAMGEIDSFAETANRFLKLKPDNPLALVMKSIATALNDEPVENTAHYLLSGMSESRDSLPALTDTAIRVLMQSMAANGNFSLVGYWAEIYGALSQQGPQDDSPLADPQINLLAKVTPKVIREGKDASYKERIAEVNSLIGAFRFAQAETKLRAILRDFPEQPGPLSQLLLTQCVQLQQQAAHDTAMKLADHLDVDPGDRVYYRALAYELQPRRKLLDCDLLIKYCELESESSLEEALSKLDFVESPEGEGIEQVRVYYANVVGDEVPAKRIFSIFDRPIGKSDSAEGERQIASSLGTVITYGKQTDKPARALLLANRLPAYQPKIDQVLEVIHSVNDLNTDNLPIENVYTEFLRRPHVIVGQPDQRLSLEEQGQQLVEDFLHMRVAALEYQSPLEVAEDERKRGQLLGLLAHLEGEQALVVTSATLESLFQRLGLERPKTAVPASGEALQLQTVLDMDRIPPAELDDNQLKSLTARAMQLGARRVLYACCLEVRQRESLADDAAMQNAALSGLLMIEPDVEKRIAICDELIRVLEKAKAPIGRIVIQKMTLLQATGQTEAARQTIEQAVRKHPEDPYLMSFLQYVMSQSAGPATAGEGLGMRSASTDSKSGLVLPGQEGGTSEGSGKLWLPGS